MTNHLAGELSPYLRQHAHNPVDWYPWGEAALNKARQEDKPVFLSIGYASCHWCHVMAHESFEDARIAAILNAHFVSIKVDREERPDLDRVYMAAVQAISGRGGWPMSVFLLPDGSPFYGGTYFPPAPRYGMPSFEQVLLSIEEAWRERREELLDGAQQLVGLIQRSASPDMASGGGGQLDEALPGRMVASLAAAFDKEHKGWGEGIKFPQPMLIAFLLRHHRRTGDALALRLATETLEAMARGGLYDQIGGGLHRYTVDEAWRVPHFEKMLYDNAQLARVYTHAWQITGQPLYRAVAEETLDYVLREMRDPAGGFYAAQDADSEGEEGKYFVWSLAELKQSLGEEAPAFARAYGATEGGNFEGSNVLAWQDTWAEREALSTARRRLLAERQRRVAPGRDDKVLVSWNGLMLAALADAGLALGRADYVEAARNNAAFLLSTLRTAEGLLRHSWIAGVAAGEGFLDDYTHLIEGLLALYQATLEERWAVAAAELLEQALAHFGAEQGFYDTGAQHEQLVVRPRELSDNAVPSGNGMIVGALLRLAVLLERPDLAGLAHTLLDAMQSMLVRYPQAFGQWLGALELAQAPLTQVVVCGERGDAVTESLLTTARAGFQPGRLIGWVDPRQDTPGLPFLRGHALVDGHSAAYVCQGSVCHAPVITERALRELLATGAQDG